MLLSSGNTRPIRQLPESVILQIAAGEAVERPASVVKELIENALDAGATRIEIRIADGGRKLIAVTDDGCGIASEEVQLALQSHATSKIIDIEDISRISTLGFRGEALATISAVSHLDLLTRAKGMPMGVRVRSEGGEVRSTEPTASTTGTTVVVSNLFFNTPARKKFMRSKATELSHIMQIIQRIAMANPSVAIFVENEGEIQMNLPAAGDLLMRLVQIYGKETTSKLVPISGTDGDFRVVGSISDGKLNYARPEEIWLFVNGRPVKDRMLQAAVMEGYRTALMERRYPFAVILLEMPADKVDVNVHPAKTEVRFAEPQRIFQVVSRTIARTLSRPETPTSYESISPRMTAHESGVGEQASMWTAQARTAPADYIPLAPAPSGPFASLEYLGTVDRTYLICRSSNSLVLIDQHAAHERVLFERFRKNQTEVQPLLVPLTMEVPANQDAILQQILPVLSRIGIVLEHFGDRTYLVKEVPAILGNHDPRPLLLDLLSQAMDENDRAPWEDRLDDIMSRVACHSAVRAHDALGPVEIRSLLSQMDEVNLAQFCPHGRPTFAKLSLGDLERLFRRK